MIQKGFKSIERGRVIYNTAVQCYQVIYSKALFNDKQFRDDCIKAFNLSECRFEFEALSHYYKCELTGNSSVDEHYFDFYEVFTLYAH